MAKKEENLIHLRFDYSEAKGGKRDILSSQMGMLKISQNLANYKKLRLEELKKKEKIYSKLASLKVDLNKLHKLMPVLKIPKILERKEDVIERKVEEKLAPEIKRYGTIEDQLRQIQEKLKLLER